MGRSPPKALTEVSIPTPLSCWGRGVVLWWKVAVLTTPHGGPPRITHRGGPPGVEELGMSEQSVEFDDDDAPLVEPDEDEWDEGESPYDGDETEQDAETPS
jgi:hypothetical protein